MYTDAEITSKNRIKWYFFHEKYFLMHATTYMDIKNEGKLFEEFSAQIYKCVNSKNKPINM